MKGEEISLFFNYFSYAMILGDISQITFICLAYFF